MSEYFANKHTLKVRRERKLAETLAIITSIFVCCWLPFFVVALLRPLCGVACDLPIPMVSIVNWLGYTNSTLNPIIYTVFSPDFKAAFSRILFKKKLTLFSSCRV